jgi:hypothetical protein
MGQKDRGIDVVDTMNHLNPPSTKRQEPACGTTPHCCKNCQIWPPDSLTRLLMQADSVTEIALDALLRRVAASRAHA